MRHQQFRSPQAQALRKSFCPSHQPSAKAKAHHAKLEAGCRLLGPKVSRSSCFPGSLDVTALIRLVLLLLGYLSRYEHQDKRDCEQGPGRCGA